MKLCIQVLDDSNAVRFQEQVDVPAELFHAPDSREDVDGMLGIKTAVDYVCFRRFRQGPISYECAVFPEVLNAGDPVTVTGTAHNLWPDLDANYSWSTTAGGVISGNTNIATIDTSGLAEGWYTVKGHVDQGCMPGQQADAEAQFCIGNDVG